jgi:queuosine precursor transporter
MFPETLLSWFSQAIQMLSNEALFFLQVLIIALGLVGGLMLGRGALESLVALFAAMMNLFVLKEVELFGLTVTPTDAFTIGVVFGLNLIHELYGYAAAKRAIWVGFYTTILMMVFSQIHLAFTPAPCDMCGPSYAVILVSLPRLVTASLITYLIVMFLDTWWYRYLKSKTWPIIGGSGPHKKHHLHLIFRNLVAVAPTQFLDTLLFSLMGLSGIVHHISHVILVSYSIKLIAILLVTPFLLVSKKFYATHHHTTAE